MITLRLPIPPSTNQLFGVAAHGRRYKTDKYRAWMVEADGYLIQQKTAWHRKTINAPYAVTLRLPKIRGDADNRLKATLDYLVSRLIVPDDRHCHNPQAIVTSSLRGETCEVVIESLADA